MSKYSYEFKKKVVNEYLNGKGGTVRLADKYGIGSHAQIQRWIAAYQKFGDQGLAKSRNKDIYSFEMKLSIVELYLSSEISYQELALQEGITNPTIVSHWVSLFRQFGPEGLRPHKKGRKRMVNKQEETSSIQPTEIKNIDTGSEHVKELEDEIYKLRLENAFLKELRRLRLEDEAKTRERRESSTASEDSSN